MEKNELSTLNLSEIPKKTDNSISREYKEINSFLYVPNDDKINFSLNFSKEEIPISGFSNNDLKKTKRKEIYSSNIQINKAPLRINEYDQDNFDNGSTNEIENFNDSMDEDVRITEQQQLKLDFNLSPERKSKGIKSLNSKEEIIANNNQHKHNSDPIKINQKLLSIKNEKFENGAYLESPIRSNIFLDNELKDIITIKNKHLGYAPNTPQFRNKDLKHLNQEKELIYLNNKEQGNNQEIMQEQNNNYLLNLMKDMDLNFNNEEINEFKANVLIKKSQKNIMRFKENNYLNLLEKDNNSNGNSLKASSVKIETKNTHYSTTTSSTIVSTTKGSKPNIEKKKELEIIIENILIGQDIRTLLIIRNIPNKYTIDDIISEIDESFLGKFNYIYMPIDKERKHNLGYAYINFIEPLNIILFYETYNNKRWSKYKTYKKIDIFYSDNQVVAFDNLNDYESYLAINDKKLNNNNFKIEIKIPFCYLDFFKKIYPKSVCIVENKHLLANDKYFIVKSIKKN